MAKGKKLGCTSNSKDDDADFNKQVEEIMNGEYGQAIEDLLAWVEAIDEENLMVQKRLAILVAKTKVEPISEDRLSEKNSSYLMDLLEQFVNGVLKGKEAKKE